MSGLLEKVFLLGLGAVALTEEKARAFVDELVEKGEVKREQREGILAELLSAGERGKAELERFVNAAVEKALSKMNLAKADEVARLKEEVEALKARLGESGR